jgi:hypothetical protein
VLINSKASTVKLSKLATGMKAGVYCDMVSGGNKPIVTRTVNKKAVKACAGAQIVIDSAGRVTTSVGAQTAFAIATTSKLR